MRRWARQLLLLRRMNWVLTAAMLVLVVIGVLFIYSACYVSEDSPVRNLYVKQGLWALTGLFSYLFFTLYDYRQLAKMAPWIYLAGLVLLICVLIIGTRISGSRRWLMVFGVGVQPSELAKVATILLIAGHLGHPGAELGRFRLLLWVAGVVGLPMLLILSEPDLGTAAVFVPMAVAMMFVAGMRTRTLLVLAVLGVAVVSIVLAAVVVPARMELPKEKQEQILKCVGMRSYHQKRILAFLDPDHDPLGAGWNKMQSEIAVGSGGAWGKGYLKGTQNVLGFLPRSVAPTDFIYSVIAEEKGYVGSLMLLLLYGLLCGSGLLVAWQSPDTVGRLLCVGIVTTLFCHVFVNIAMTIGILPITGLPLPLLSYGGSFTVITMSALGIVQSVCIRSHRVVHAI